MDYLSKIKKDRNKLKCIRSGNATSLNKDTISFALMLCIVSAFQGLT